MRQIFRFNFALVFTCSLICLCAELSAQQPAKAKPGQKQQPAANTPPVRKAPPKEEANDADADKEAAILAQKKMLARLDEILLRWEAESAKIKTLHGKQSRSEFNHTFAVEKVSEGPFFLETPDKGRIDLKPIKIDKGSVSERKTKETAESKSKHYSLETGKPERWICTGEAIVMINDDEKTYQKELIPEDQRGKNIVESPLPFLFGIKAEEAKNRFKLSIVQETKDTVMILAIPKMEKDKDNYQKAAITLDLKKYLPTQVRLLDQSKLEIVYTFTKVEVNDSSWKSKVAILFGLDKDPFRPNLKGYTVVTPTEPQIQPTAGADANDRDQVKQGIHRGPQQKPPGNAARPAPGINRN